MESASHGKRASARQLLSSLLTIRNRERPPRRGAQRAPNDRRRILEDIRKSGDLSDATAKKLKGVVDAYAKTFA